MLGLRRMASVLKQAKGEPWKKARESDSRRLVASLPPGTAVWASVAGDGRCDLERRPELQGGLLVLDQGRVRAMVGGNDNRDFNRAVEARRQLAPRKPLVYHAAMQLGWTPTDKLDNREGVFHFEGNRPRADHRWMSGVRRVGRDPVENPASWLLAHLLIAWTVRDPRGCGTGRPQPTERRGTGVDSRSGRSA